MEIVAHGAFPKDPYFQILREGKRATSLLKRHSVQVQDLLTSSHFLLSGQLWL